MELSKYKLNEHEQIKLELATFRVRCLIDPLSLTIPTTNHYVIEKKMKNGCWKRISGISKFSVIIDGNKKFPECTLEYIDGFTNLTEDDSEDLPEPKSGEDYSI